MAAVKCGRPATDLPGGKEDGMPADRRHAPLRLRALEMIEERPLHMRSAKATGKDRSLSTRHFALDPAAVA
jgi:hypothetical protein